MVGIQLTLPGFGVTAMLVSGHSATYSEKVCTLDEYISQRNGGDLNDEEKELEFQLMPECYPDDHWPGRHHPGEERCTLGCVFHPELMYNEWVDGDPERIAHLRALSIGIDVRNRKIGGL